MWANLQFPLDLFTFTKETLNRKLHFCAVCKIWEIFYIVIYRTANLFIMTYLESPQLKRNSWKYLRCLCIRWRRTMSCVNILKHHVNVDEISVHFVQYYSLFGQWKTRVFRSSPPEVFLGKGVLKKCSKFIGEHPCRSAISIKLRENS